MADAMNALMPVLFGYVIINESDINSEVHMRALILESNSEF
jgi:hypothetical protein